MNYKHPLSLALMLASLAMAHAGENGYPIGWVYAPTSGVDHCDRAHTRCVITSKVVDVYSRPNKKSSVVITLKGGGNVFVHDWVGNYTWIFIVSACPVVPSDGEFLSIQPDQNDPWCRY